MLFVDVSSCCFLSPPRQVLRGGPYHDIKDKKKIFFFVHSGSEYARAPAYGIDRDRDSTVVGERTTLHPEYARVVSAHKMQVSKKNVPSKQGPHIYISI